MRPISNWTVRAILVIVVVALALLLPTRASTAQTPAPRDTIERPPRGRLIGFFDVESGDQVTGVEVRDSLAIALKRPPITLVTTNTAPYAGLAGFAALNDSIGVHVRKIGYKDTLLLLSARDTVPITLMLEHATMLTLDTVRTSAARFHSAALEGFAERRNNHAYRGKFVGRDSIRSFDGLPLSRLLQQRGMIPMPRGQISLRVTRCRTLYYLNGSLMRGFDPTKENVDAYDAVEFYPSKDQAPPEYVGAFSADVCGIFLLWMR
jgi:hypothetical protein